jgi:hypothetical protein
VVWSPPVGDCALLPIVEPAEGGDELCSVAPPEVSALPDGGMVADLDASGDVVFAVGGLVGGDEFSVAMAGVYVVRAWCVIQRYEVINCAVLNSLKRRIEFFPSLNLCARSTVCLSG